MLLKLTLFYSLRDMSIRAAVAPIWSIGAKTRLQGGVFQFYKAHIKSYLITLDLHMQCHALYSYIYFCIVFIVSGQAGGRR